MFVIEKMFSDFRARQEAWERARDRWIAEGKTGDFTNFRNEREYRENHPSPADKVRFAVRGAVIVVLIVIMAFIIAGLAREIIRDNKNKPKEVPAVVEKPNKNCQYFNKDDKVRIQYGDHAGNVGTIIGGCEIGNHYQVKIDEGSKANVSDSNSEAVDVGGWIISVDDKDNLAVIEDKKE